MKGKPVMSSKPMMGSNHVDKPLKKKLTLLVLLVAMIFSILLVSVIISGCVVIFLLDLNIIHIAQHESRLFIVVFYMLLVSLLTGTVLAGVAGKHYLRQIHELAELTKEVAAGNFNVRMTPGYTREVDLIVSSFNEMVKELANIETLRSDFVSNISHEFKTPVASIRGFARRLKKASLTDEQRAEYLDIIVSESERLTGLSSNVLLLSRLESTEKVAEETEYALDEQLRRTVLLLEPQLQRKAVEVDVMLEEARIFANEEILNHVWINLIENAIKFSHDGGTVTISLSVSDGDAVVAIADNGIGMDDDVMKRIFDKFYQGDRSRATEGNGLGLSLVKKILELEHGSITVDSEPGKGACFTVSMPAR